MCRVLAAICLAVLGSSCGSAPRIEWQDPKGKLQRATDRAAAPSLARTRSNRSWSVADDDDESFFEGFLNALFGEMFEGFAENVLGPLLKYSIGLPWAVPAMLVERGPYWSSGNYLDYPYQVDEPFIAPVFTRSSIAPRDRTSTRLHLEVGSDFDQIERVAASLRWETVVRFGLEASWIHLREDLGAGRTDRLDLGDANLIFRFAQAGYGEMRTGLGVNWLADAGVREAGFNFTYSGDFYPVDPLTLSFEFDAGRVGEASRIHARATVGAVWEGVELTTGYDYERIGGVGLPTWVIGGRIWF